MSASLPPEPKDGDLVLGTPHRNVFKIPDAAPRQGDLVLGFQPSAYQKAIFEWLKSGKGSCVVEAVPGSGKTTTLIKGANYIPRWRHSCFLAFNKHIVEELSSKLPKHVKASTIHSLGLSSIARRYKGVPEIEPKKYRELASEILNQNKIFDLQERKHLSKLVKFTQLTLTNPFDTQALKQLCHHYGIPTSGNWELLQKGVCEVLDRGINTADRIISYEDMVWLPYVLDLPVYTYDFLAIDEVQDLNSAQLELVLKAHKTGARGIYVGDPHQAIFGFTAADRRSISNIIEKTGAIQLPLSICYRCPTSHIELANQIYPVITPKTGAIEGTVTEIGKKEIPKFARPADLIICRCFYPLIPVYFDLIAAGISAKIRNKDMTKQLIELLDTIVGESGREYTIDAFSQILNDWYIAQKAEMTESGASVMAIVKLHDQIQSLNAIYRRLTCTSTNTLKEAIAEISNQCDNGIGVNLTTIHGAKGLEAARVFHLRPDLVPHPYAVKPWEIEQENNLLFVALTRAKKDLFIAK